MTTPAKSQNLWAVIIKPKRGREWINWNTIRALKKDAKAAYLEGILAHKHEERLRNVRFARVIVVEDVPSAGEQP